MVCTYVSRRKYRPFLLFFTMMRLSKILVLCAVSVFPQGVLLFLWLWNDHKKLLKMRCNTNFFVEVIAVVLLLSFGGCKPTEKNYKSAYDSALAKRQAAEADLQVPAGERIILEGEPVPRAFGSDTVYCLTVRVAPITDGSRSAGKYALAVGCFKMPANALDQARALRDAGEESFAVRAQDSRFYTLCGDYDSMEDAYAAYRLWKTKRPDYPSVGLPGITILENH